MPPYYDMNHATYLYDIHCLLRHLIAPLMLNPEFHWLRQIATTLSKFHWQFWIFLDAIAKAKKLIRKSIAQNLKWVSLTKKFRFGNGVKFTPIEPNLTKPSHSCQS